MALFAAGLVLSGCSGAVAVPEPSPDAVGRRVCADVMANIPATVLEGTRRTTTKPELTAAWGDPPITLRCGVPAPPGLTASSECLEVDGVGWYAEPAEGGMLYTTIGRAVFVEVGVPTRYAPEAGALVDLAAVVKDRNPTRQPCQ